MTILSESSLNILFEKLVKDFVKDNLELFMRAEIQGVYGQRRSRCQQ
nr:hypothetical protein [Paenibacillus albidus]